MYFPIYPVGGGFIRPGLSDNFFNGFDESNPYLNSETGGAALVKTGNRSYSQFTERAYTIRPYFFLSCIF